MLSKENPLPLNAIRTMINLIIPANGTGTVYILGVISKVYTANFYLMKNTRTGNCGVKICSVLFSFGTFGSFLVSLGRRWVYRVTQKGLNDFWKVGVATKWVKPCLQNFLCFLSIIIAKISENLVAIALIISLSMAFLCQGIGGHK